MIVLVVITLIVDFVWLIYWGPFWRSDIMKDYERGIHTFTIIMSIVGLFYKIIVLIFLILGRITNTGDDLDGKRLNNNNNYR